MNVTSFVIELMYDLFFVVKSISTTVPYDSPDWLQMFVMWQYCADWCKLMLSYYIFTLDTIVVQLSATKAEMSLMNHGRHRLPVWILSA